MKAMIAGLIAAAALSGCSDGTFQSTKTNGNTAQAIAQANGISVSAALASECSSGGSVYRVFVDANSNGLYDDGETIVNEQIVCNGTNGSNGLNSLFSVTRVSTGLAACSSGSGLQINNGLDANSNNVLDASEIVGTQVLCDGATGSAGTAGAAGSDGFSMVFQSVPASAQTCPAGGVVVMMALDTNRNKIFDNTDSSPQSITLCNGMTGATGAAGAAGSSATLPAYTPMDAIMPCGNTVAQKEVLLRLENGQILSSVSDTASGSMTRLSFLADGTYIDTDDSSCQFTLATSGTTRSIAWFGRVQQTWSFSK